MGRAPSGALVRITYDGEPVQEGEAMRTPSGRLYVVTYVRVQHRGLHVGRQYLRCLVVDEISDGTVVHPLVWYPRKKRT